MIVCFSILYTVCFLANVAAADAAKWLESTGMSVFQDFVCKPVFLALGYATLSSLVLSCYPRVKDTVTEQWIHPVEELDDHWAEDPAQECVNLSNGQEEAASEDSASLHRVQF